MRPSQTSAPRPVTSYLAKFETSIMPTPLRTARHSAATTSWALERLKVTSSCGSFPFFWNQSACSSPKEAPKTAFSAFSASWIAVVRAGRAAFSSSLGKVMENRRE